MRRRDLRAAAGGARNGNRTRKDLSIRRILSPLRLPISPSGRLLHRQAGRIIGSEKEKAPHCGEAFKLEARPGVEPGSTDLQSGA